MLQKRYGAMANYGDGYDGRDNDRNTHGNNDKNCASGSVYDGMIFDLITTL